MDYRNIIDAQLQFYEVPTRKEIQQEINPILIIGELFLDPSARWMKYKGQTVSISRAEFDILYSIATKMGCFIKAEYICVHSANWVSMVVKRIRKIMGEEFIITNSKKGYRLNLGYDRPSSSIPSHF